MRTEEGQTGKDFHTLNDVCVCMLGDRGETCGMSRSGFCSTSPGKWNHPQAHRENHWSSEYQRRTWCAGVGVVHWMTSSVCPPAPGQEKAWEAALRPGLGAALHALSMPLLSKLRAAATCERKLCPLGTSH